MIVNELAILVQMLKRDMGTDVWRQCIFAQEPNIMYGLSVVRPISCQPKQNRITVEICYPIIKKTDMYSLFRVEHRGAFNSDETVFGYANVAEHIAVPLYDVSRRQVGSVENVDLARCELKVNGLKLCFIK